MAKAEKLLNTGELAQAIGVNRAFVTRMKRAGFLMPGGRSTAAWALEWLRQNPEALHTGRRKAAMASAMSAGSKRR